MPRSLAGFSFFDLIAVKLEKLTDPETDCWLIFDKQDSISSHPRSPRSAVGILQSYKLRLQDYYQRAVCRRALPWLSEQSRAPGLSHRGGWKRKAQRFWISFRAEFRVRNP